MKFVTLDVRSSRPLPLEHTGFDLGQYKSRLTLLSPSRLKKTCRALPTRAWLWLSRPSIRNACEGSSGGGGGSSSGAQVDAKCLVCK
jgi:hypothetical protein